MTLLAMFLAVVLVGTGLAALSDLATYVVERVRR